MNETRATYAIRSLAGAIWAGRAGSLAWAIDFAAAFGTGLPVLVCGESENDGPRLADQVAAATGLRLRRLVPKDGRTPTIGEWLTHDEAPPHLNFVSHLERLRYGKVLTSVIAPLDEYWNQREPEGQWILAAVNRAEDLTPQVRFKFGVALALPSPAAQPAVRRAGNGNGDGVQLPRALTAADLAELKQFLSRRGSEIRKRRRDEMARLVDGLLAKHEERHATDLHSYRPRHAIPLVAAAYELIGAEGSLERATRLVCQGRMVKGSQRR